MVEAETTQIKTHSTTSNKKGIVIAIGMVAEKTEGPRTMEVNNKEQGYKEFISLMHGQEKSTCPMEKLNNAWVELYSHLHANFYNDLNNDP